MPFQYKNLVIQTIPQAGAGYCVYPSVPCRMASRICKLVYSYQCPNNSIVFDWTVGCPLRSLTDDDCPIISPVVDLPGRDVIDPAGELEQLKGQLNAALAEVERRQAALQPQTVEELDQLEAGLEGALKEVRTQKKKLTGA